MANMSDESLFMFAPGSADAPPLKLSSLSVEQLIVLLREHPSQRGQAIHVLSQRRDENENLALALWYMPHITSILLLEVVGALKLLTPWKLTNREVERVCDALALFTLVASHKETRKPFLEARMPEYLYPFLKATVTGPPQVDHLKAISLGVIAGLVKDDDPDAVQLLLETEVFPDCVHCLEHGSETLNTYAACIISKMLGQAKGIEYICDSVPRFHAVAVALGNVVNRLDQTSSPSLLKHIINCYYKLSKEGLCHAERNFASEAENPCISKYNTCWRSTRGHRNAVLFVRQHHRRWNARTRMMEQLLLCVIIKKQSGLYL